MLSHDRVWAAIDALADKHRLTPSGLARKSGLDPTSFNKSKRQALNGRMRWPSTESISKALRATGTTLEEFLHLVTGESGRDPLTPASRDVPLLGFAQAGVGGFFDDGGFPVGQGWEEVNFPNGEHDTIYALEVSGDSMLPLYRDGDVLIVAPGATVRRGDRVVAKTRDGEVMVKVLARKTARTVELESLNPEHEHRKFDLEELEWLARIIWASQ